MTQLFRHPWSRHLPALGLGLLLPLTPACSESDIEGTPPTYHQDIAPLNGSEVSFLGTISASTDSP